MPARRQPSGFGRYKKERNACKKANVGKAYRPKGEPLEVDTHDFPDKELGKAIRRWWRQMGKKRYPKPTRLLITADSGGSNGHRNRLWKYELQRLADQT